MSVALHILIFLDKFSEKPQSSTLLASSVGTNPVVVRRLVLRLEERGMVKSVAGSKGGLLLKKKAEDISLWEVFEAVNGENIFSTHETSHPDCPVGSQMPRVLQDVFGRVEDAVQKVMQGVSVADCANKV
jgi:Rrf2 family protein